MSNMPQAAQLLPAEEACPELFNGLFVRVFKNMRAKDRHTAFRQDMESLLGNQSSRDIPFLGIVRLDGSGRIANTQDVPEWLNTIPSEQRLAELFRGLDTLLIDMLMLSMESLTKDEESALDALAQNLGVQRD